MKRYVLSSLCLVALFCLSNCSSNETTEQNKEETPVVDTLATTNPDSDLAIIVQALNNLVEKNAEDVRIILDNNKEAIDQFTPEQMDTLFFHTYKALERYTLNKSPEIDYDNDHNENGELKSEIYEANWVNGIDLDAEEGTYFYYIHWPFLEKYFSKKLSPNMQAYMDYKLKNRDKISYDAGLSISPMEQAKRVIAMEDLFAKGPFIMQDHLLEHYSYELMWLMSGMDNTPSYDWETGAILEDFKSAYQYAIKNSKNITKKYITKYWKIIEKNKFQYVEGEPYTSIKPEEIEQEIRTTYFEKKLQ